MVLKALLKRGADPNIVLKQPDAIGWVSGVCCRVPAPRRSALMEWSLICSLCKAPSRQRHRRYNQAHHRPCAEPNRPLFITRAGSRILSTPSYSSTSARILSRRPPTGKRSWTRRAKRRTRCVRSLPISSTRPSRAWRRRTKRTRRRRRRRQGASAASFSLQQEQEQSAPAGSKWISILGRVRDLG